MPANLTPQYYAAEQAFREATAVEDKIAALEEMLAVIPKHKGTEKLQADIKRRLSRLREEGEKKRRTGGTDPFKVDKQGAGQVVLFGFPNSGKSSLVAALTRARVTVADYPFSTSLPVAGMMPFEDVMVQLVDTPPVTVETIPPGLTGTLRNADALAMVIDVGADDCLDQLEGCLAHLRERRILGDDLSRSLVLAAKADLDPSGEALALVRELAPPGLEIIPVSTKTGLNLGVLPGRLFHILNVIRVYSKVPGKEADRNTPFILKRGSTILDMAGAVHREFPEKLKNARVWGSARFDGQSVTRDYVLQDGDVVELHV